MTSQVNSAALPLAEHRSRRRSEPMRPDARAWFRHRTTSAAALAAIDADGAAARQAPGRPPRLASSCRPATRRRTVGRLVADLRERWMRARPAGRRARSSSTPTPPTPPPRSPAPPAPTSSPPPTSCPRHGTPPRQGRGAVEVAGRHHRRPGRLPRRRPARRRRPLRARAARAAADRSAGAVREGLLHPAAGARRRRPCRPAAGG